LKNKHAMAKPIVNVDEMARFFGERISLSSLSALPQAQNDPTGSPSIQVNWQTVNVQRFQRHQFSFKFAGSMPESRIFQRQAAW